jgi:hypothetical protein
LNVGIILQYLSLVISECGTSTHQFRVAVNWMQWMLLFVAPCVMSGNIQSALAWPVPRLVVGTYVLIATRKRIANVLSQAVLMKQVGGNGEAQGVASELQAIPKSLNCVFLCLHISDQNVGSLELLTAHHHCLSTMQYDLGVLSRVWRTDWMKTCVKLKIARTHEFCMLKI